MFRVRGVDVGAESRGGFTAEALAWGILDAGFRV